MLSTFATEITTGRLTKEETSLKRYWSCHYSYSRKLWKTMETHEKKASLQKTRFWILELVTRRECVSTLQRPSDDSTFN